MRALYREIEDDTLRKVLLATQLPEVKQVYPFIASDWDSIQFRAPGVLENYKMDPKELEKLLDHVIVSSYPAQLKEFAESVKAPPGKELLAFFARKYPDNALHLEGPVYHKIREYKGSFDPVEIGKWIQSIQWKEWETEPVAAVVPTPPTLPMVPMIPTLPISEPTPWVESDHRLNPTIVKYRREADLPGRFPVDKIAKQMVYQQLGKDVLPYMGKQQTHLPAIVPLDPEVVSMVVDHLMTTEEIKELLDSQAVQDYIHKKRIVVIEDGRKLIKDYLNQ